MTDQDSYTLAGWIERARKATEALTRYGYVIAANGEWVLSDRAIARLAHRPATAAKPDGFGGSGVSTQPSTPPTPTAKPNGYVYPDALPPLTQEEISERIEAWRAAIKAGDRGCAGRIQKELFDKSVALSDGPCGTSWWRLARAGHPPIDYDTKS